MLKKEYRLKTFSLNNPKQVTTPLFNVKMARNEAGTSRFAFVVSKRIDKRSAVRNQLKRKLRVVVEEIFDNIKEGFDFIFYPKSKITQVDKDQILNELNKYLNKEKLLK